METKKRRKRIRISKGLRACIMLLIFLAFVFVVKIMNDSSERGLLNNVSITTGTISDLYTSGKGGMSISYGYTVKGKELDRSESADKSVFSTEPVRRLFIGQAFPVIYDSTHPGYSHILIDPKDFLKYRVAFPDSLKWVIHYFRNR